MIVAMSQSSQGPRVKDKCYNWHDQPSVAALQNVKRLYYGVDKIIRDTPEL